MSKLKSIIEQRTKAPLTGQRKSCFDCVHVLPSVNADEVTCEIYTFKYEQYQVARKRALRPSFANTCPFYQAMTPEEKTISERKFREFYKRLR
jgi:hypothetical protein